MSASKDTLIDKPLICAEARPVSPSLADGIRLYSDVEELSSVLAVDVAVRPELKIPLPAGNSGGLFPGSVAIVARSLASAVFCAWRLLTYAAFCEREPLDSLVFC